MRLSFLALCLGLSFSSAQAATKTTSDGRVYKLVCQNGKVAEFLEGFTGKARCIFVEENILNSYVKRDRPCPKDAKGQFLDGLFGRQCETWEHRQIDPRPFARVTTCDDSNWAQIKAGLFGIPACKDAFVLQSQFQKAAVQQSNVVEQPANAAGEVRKVETGFVGTVAPEAKTYSAGIGK